MRTEGMNILETREYINVEDVPAGSCLLRCSFILVFYDYTLCCFCCKFSCAYRYEGDLLRRSLRCSVIYMWLLRGLLNWGIPGRILASNGEALPCIASI